MTEIYALKIRLENSWDSEAYLSFFFKNADVGRVAYSRSVTRVNLDVPPRKVDEDPRYVCGIHEYYPKTIVTVKSKQGHERNLPNEYVSWVDRLSRYYGSQFKLILEEPILHPDFSVKKEDGYKYYDGTKKQYMIDRGVEV